MAEPDGDVTGADPVPAEAEQPSERNQAAQGGRWGIISALCEQGGSILATVVLARLLTPEDFGVVAAATVVLNLLVTFGQAGFAQSIVRRDTIEEPVASSIWWTGIGLGSLSMVICMLLAPVMAAVLKQPDITPYVVALAPLLLISMVGAMSEARLLRELRFRWVYAADITNIAVYASLTIAFAAAGMGAWSMVWGRVIGELVTAVMRYWSAGWHPRWTFSRDVVREDLHFNGHLVLNGQLSFFSKNIDYWVVSRALGADALGTYYVAFVLPNILRQRITWLSNELMLPLMARVKTENDRLVAILRESTEIASAVAVPLLVGIALTAPEIIRIAFGPQWTDAVGPMRWLAVGAAVDGATQGICTAFVAIGKPGMVNRSSFIRLAAMAIGLGVVLSQSENLTAFAAAVAIAGVISRATLMVDMRAELNVGPLRLLSWVAPVLAGTAVMVAAVLLVNTQIQDLGVIVRAAIEVLVGVAAYSAGVFAYSRRFAMQMLRTGKELATGGR